VAFYGWPAGLFLVAVLAPLAFAQFIPPEKRVYLRAAAKARARHPVTYLRGLLSEMSYG